MPEAFDLNVFKAIELEILRYLSQKYMIFFDLPARGATALKPLVLAE
jgi:hypothetical protein